VNDSLALAALAALAALEPTLDEATQRHRMGDAQR
jgi:hypothetical protein